MANSPKKIQAIRELWEADMPAVEIAELMGLHEKSIYRILVRMGAREPHGSSGKRLTTEEKVDILTLYQGGLTVDEIIEAVGCSRPTVYRYVNEAGLSRGISEDAVAKALKLYKDTDLKVTEICSMTGISKPTFYRKLKKELKGSS